MCNNNHFAHLLILLYSLSLSHGVVTKYGPTVNTTWQGSFTPYFRYDKNGRPLQLGFQFPSSVLENLPETASDGKYDIYTCTDGPNTGENFRYLRGHSFELSFPQEVNVTAYVDGYILVYPQGVVALNGIRSAPDLRFHFQLISKDERLAIPSAYCVQDMCNLTTPIGPFYASISCAEIPAVAAILPADETPPTYAQDWNLVVGKVGNILVPTTEPSWTPDPNDGDNPTELRYITSYGHINGLYFSSTIDYLKSKVLSSKVCKSIYTPQAFKNAGKYATKYCYKYDPHLDSYLVYLTKFAYFRASTGVLDPFTKSHHSHHPKP